MHTSVSICTNALLMLGAQTIASLTENTDRARLCANLYPTVRDDLLRAHPWNCAVKRVQLAPETTAPAWGYSYAYALPPDWLRTLAVGDDGFEIDYRHESGKLLADANPLKFRYIWRNDQEATWDAAMVNAITLAMAARMAYAITQSNAREQALQQELVITLKRARAADGQDDPPQTLGDFPLLNARYGG